MVNSPSDLPEEQHTGHIIVTGAGPDWAAPDHRLLVERGHQVSSVGRRYQKLQNRKAARQAVIGIAADPAHHEGVDVAFAAAVGCGLPDMVITVPVSASSARWVSTAEQIRRVVESNLISTILGPADGAPHRGDRAACWR